MKRKSAYKKKAVKREGRKKSKNHSYGFDGLDKLLLFQVNKTHEKQILEDCGYERCAEVMIIVGICSSRHDDML